jgi:thiosulfate/3-mercaptopyruvate sulfurtransferase
MENCLSCHCCQALATISPEKVSQPEQRCFPREGHHRLLPHRRRSSHPWFVLKYLLGILKVRNYDGSWTEWGNLVGAPIERS